MTKFLNIIFSVLPTGERNGGLLKLNRGLSWVAVSRPLSTDAQAAAFGPIAGLSKPKIKKKKSFPTIPKLNSPFGATNKDEILNSLHRFNKDLADFKDNIIIPQRVKILMDLAESTHNPWGWWYQVDKESDGHFAIWLINKSTDKVFYGYSGRWKNGKILDYSGFYQLKAPKPDGVAANLNKP
jgi:hypothetical protein